MERVGAALGGHGDIEAGGMAEGGVKIGCLDFEFVDDIGAGHDGHATVSTVGGGSVHGPFIAADAAGHGVGGAATDLTLD
jgi:hypothetical protein